MIKRIILMSVILFPNIILAQQLDKIGNAPALKINGSLNKNMVYRHSDAYNNPDPLSLVLTGNLTTSIYEWSIPLSFTWSNYNWTYTQPFNQLSLHPSYKWITTHIGYTSMTFSPWSLNGHSFAGLGVDLTPGNNFKFSAMYGRLIKETKGDSAQNVLPAYQRMGTGFNAEYQFSNGSVGANVFYATDEDSYIPVADSLGILPAENLVLGLKGQYNLLNSLTFLVEGNTSIIADNIRASKATDWKSNTNSQYYAFKSSLSWAFSLAQVGATFERVDPGYRSLGSYFTNEDYINYTFDLATSIWQQKISLGVNTGIRKNNLDNKSEQNSNDRINNIQVGFTPSENLNITTSYSNFYNYSFIRTVFEEAEAHTQYELLDTLSFTQINESITFAGNYAFGNKETNPQNINLNLTMQKAGQKQSDNPDHSNSEFYNATGGYMYNMKAIELSCGLNINYSINKSNNNDNRTLGPMLFFRKSFFEKKLKSSCNLSYNSSSANGKKQGNSFTSRLSFSYMIKKKHALNTSFAYSSRNYNNRKQNNITAQISYSYNFGWPRKKDDDQK